MAIWDLKNQIARLPEQPGVYIYFNGSGETIYVGRARVLRQRVKTYLSKQRASPKTDALVKNVTRLEVIVTDSLVEALALENNLIKQRIPRFNILLRDDKNYPYLQVTTTEAFPRVLVARRVARDGNVYAGPFLPAALARKTMSLTHRLFGIRSCNEVINGKRGRACLEYDIKKCLAPCVESICSQTEYSEAVQRTQMFLEGRNGELLTDLNAQMRSASSEERYEVAAQYRDTIRTIETLRDRQQKMASPRLGERDVFGIKVGSSGGSIQIFQVRGGRVIERIELVADETEEGMTQPAELLRAGLQQFYEARKAPTEVHLPLGLDDQEEIETWLSGRSGHRVRIQVPKRGDKRGLVELATRNAKLSYDSRFGVDARRFGVALEELRDCLALKMTPRRIECFDISTLHGAETVGALVVNEDGRMLRRDYRKFRIRGDRRKSLGGSDDFASIEEVVIRRYRRVLEQGGPFPDLVIVDGGVGQLSAAYKAFDQLGLSNLEAIGIAKKEELLITRDRRLPIALPRDSAALQLVQRIRDEAHRFAITFHRRSRTNRDFSSELDLITGVGPKRRRALLEHFGSVKNIGRATNEELVPIVGTKVARLIIDYFSERVSNK